MTAREVRIGSYFSLPANLAAAMRSWPEFVTGAEYSADLASPTERVTVHLDTTDHEVVVRGEGDGILFDQVLGKVVHELAARSDAVFVSRYGDVPRAGSTHPDMTRP